jgi:hypothetical protein
VSGGAGDERDHAARDVPERARPSWTRRVRLGAVAVLLGAYAVPLFAPPGATPPAPVLPDATLAERLFPGVPSAWVLVRLACLAAGAVLAAAGAPRLLAGRAGGPDAGASWSPRRLGALRWVAVVAGLQAVAALFAAHFDRSMQLAFIACLFLPTLLVLALERPALPRPSGGTTTLGLRVMVLAVMASWTLLWVPIAWRSSWMANFADGNGTFEMLLRMNRPEYNLLTHTVIHGQTGLYAVVDGAGWLGAFGREITVAWVQGVHIVGALVAGAVTGLAASRLVGPSAAPVATAALLFSPIAMLETLFMGPNFLGQLLAAAMVVLLLSIHERRCATAMAAIGPIAGMAGTFPHMALVAYPSLALAVFLGRRGRLPLAARAVGVFGFAAVVMPGLPAMLQIEENLSFYNLQGVEWTSLEARTFGLIEPDLGKTQMMSGAPAPFDALAGALLSPFATPRTPMRVLGDAMYDPLAAALIAVGLAGCLRRPTRRALALVALLLLSVLAAGITIYDRYSVFRLLSSPLPAALLAAVGFEALRRQVAPRRSPAALAGACVLAMALGGWTLTTRIHPTILSRSVTGIAIEALAPADRDDATVVLSFGWGPRYLDELADPPISWFIYDERNAGPASLARPDGEPVTPLLLWNPGLEEHANLADSICRRWPGSTLFTLFDESRLSRVFAARPAGPGWRPSLPEGQWSQQPCGTPLDTERQRAHVAMQRARELTAQGRGAEALAVLRAAARRSFVQVELFRTLAATLAAHEGSAATRAEARYWTERSRRLTAGTRPST